MSYKLKVDEPILTYGSSTVKLQTTQSVNEFYVTCVIDRQVEVTTSALSMDILNFGAATNGTATTQIDTSGIFSIKTYSDNTYGTESDTYTIGSTVFAKIKADDMAQMPSIIGWEVNECKVSFCCISARYMFLFFKISTYIEQNMIFENFAYIGRHIIFHIHRYALTYSETNYDF